MFCPRIISEDTKININKKNKIPHDMIQLEISKDLIIVVLNVEDVKLELINDRDAG